MSPTLYAELSDMANGWFAKADTGVGSLYPGQDYRRCGEELMMWLSRHAPTDPAELSEEE